MDTEIAFLEQLEEDLLEAAWRKTLAIERGGRRGGARTPRRGRRPRRAPSRFRGRPFLVAASIVLVLSLAGGIGWFALNGGETNRLATAPASPARPLASASPAPGAGDSVAAGDEKQVVRQAGPPAIPAPQVFGVTGRSPSTTQADVGIGRSGISPAPQPGDLTKVIKTASISLVVGKGTFRDKFAAAEHVAERYGGYVTSSNTQGMRSGELVLRVNAKRFDVAMQALRDLGTVSRESINGKDVTADFIDLKAQLGIAEARKKSLLILLGKASSLGTILRLQNVIDDTERHIEDLQGQIRYINSQTDKATIRVSMRETGVVVTPPEKVHNPSIASALRHGIAGFFGVIAAVVIGLGYVVPIAVVALVGWLVIRRVRRRRAIA